MEKLTLDSIEELVKTFDNENCNVRFPKFRDMSIEELKSWIEDSNNRVTIFGKLQSQYMDEITRARSILHKKIDEEERSNGVVWNNILMTQKAKKRIEKIIENNSDEVRISIGEVEYALEQDGDYIIVRVDTSMWENGYKSEHKILNK